MSVETPTKVKASHLSRAAYLYVRQSTLRQVLNNTESTVRQYDLRQRAVALGWPAEQIIVVDVDQGHSGASAADREGFQRLVADVSMGRAGIVLGLECSRLARNNADWHRLLEICALTDTLICDEDGLYDPADFNDRMLLGLKGTLSEAELHFIRARLRGGQLSKARRGELPMMLPVGLVYDPTGKVVLDPDGGVHHAVRICSPPSPAPDRLGPWSRLFGPRGCASRDGSAPGRTKASCPGHRCATTGCFVSCTTPAMPGRSSIAGSDSARTQRPAPCRAPPREEWTALIPDAHPGYITWDTFELNQKLLAANAQAHGAERAAGPAREGTALLQGLAICGRCGCRMSVHYHQRSGTEIPGYRCMRAAIRDGVAPCASVPGSTIDIAIGQLLLDTVTPLALEVALTVQAELETRADEADALRKSHVERARHRAETARRRYLAVDPDNRLVADTLEADWNDALRQLQAAHDDYERAATAARAVHRRAQSPHPGPRRRLPRPVDQPGHTATGTQTHGPAAHRRRHHQQDRPDPPPRPLPRRTDHQPDHPHPAHRMASSPNQRRHPRPTRPAPRRPHRRPSRHRLNMAGHRSGTGQPFTPSIVLHLRRSNGLPSHLERLRSRGLLTIPELAEQLGVHHHHQGLAPSRPAHIPPSQRQEHPALRTTPTRRPPPDQKDGIQPRQPSFHPTIAKECSMKPSPCPSTGPAATGSGRSGGRPGAVGNRRGVLRSPVGMKQQPGGGPAGGDGHAQGVGDQVGLHVVGHGPADHPREARSITVARYAQPSQVRM